MACFVGVCSEEAIRSGKCMDEILVKEDIYIFLSCGVFSVKLCDKFENHA